VVNRSGAATNRTDLVKRIDIAIHSLSNKPNRGMSVGFYCLVEECIAMPLKRIRRFLGRTKKAVRTGKSAPVLQEFFCRLALKEIGIFTGTITVNHYNGTCEHSVLGTLPLVFPQGYLQRVSHISKEKKADFFFQGVISKKREWLKQYGNVTESQYGRTAATKYEFHQQYFVGMCASRFALAPTGDCPWSYRFFEGIMSEAIPILGDDDQDIFAEPFSYLRHSTDKSYDQSICHENYQEFLKRHTLKGLGF